MPKPKTLDIQDLKARFHYDPETGLFSFRQMPKDRFVSEKAFHEWNARYAGKAAGSIKTMTTGWKYVYLYAHGQYTQAHRIAWAIMTGEQPPNQIDHKDRDGTNNKWDNLRDGTAMNARNRGKQKNNKTGVTGVLWDERCQKWQARVILNRKKYHVGLFDSLTDAERALQAKRSELGFDSTHGY